MRTTKLAFPNVNVANAVSKQVEKRLVRKRSGLYSRQLFQQLVWANNSDMTSAHLTGMHCLPAFNTAEPRFSKVPITFRTRKAILCGCAMFTFKTQIFLILKAER